MHIMLDSPYYCVVDLIMQEGQPSAGIEIVDKSKQCELFLHGEAADAFRQQIEHFAVQQPDLDDLEAFLQVYRPWMSTSVTLH